MKMTEQEWDRQQEMEKQKGERRPTTFGMFLIQVYHLHSFNLFVLYLTAIFCSRLWKRVSKPMDLRRLMVFYNFSISLINLYTFVRFAYHVIAADSFLSRETNDAMRHTLHVYWITKVLELLDTVFMILRHRGRQISFLHVFHHSTMVILTEYGYRITPVVSVATFLGINSFIHVVLYFYYGMSALNPENPPKWKKQLTQMQIAQFIIDIGIAIYAYLNGVFCIYSLFYAASMLYLFCNFYYKAYVKHKKA